MKDSWKGTLQCHKQGRIIGNWKGCPQEQNKEGILKGNFAKCKKQRLNVESFVFGLTTNHEKYEKAGEMQGKEGFAIAKQETEEKRKENWRIERLKREWLGEVGPFTPKTFTTSPPPPKKKTKTKRGRVRCGGALKKRRLNEQEKEQTKTPWPPLRVSKKPSRATVAIQVFGQTQFHSTKSGVRTCAFVDFSFTKINQGVPLSEN